jgi:hypothetical protein
MTFSLTWQQEENDSTHWIINPALLAYTSTMPVIVFHPCLNIQVLNSFTYYLTVACRQVQP